MLCCSLLFFFPFLFPESVDTNACEMKEDRFEKLLSVDNSGREADVNSGKQILIAFNKLFQGLQEKDAKLQVRIIVSSCF